MSKNCVLLKRQWVNRIGLWKQSGKSAKAWCRENQVVYTTFIGWRTRLEGNQNVNSPLDSLETQFVELEDEPKVSPGILLECCGVMIHLKSEFDAALLQKCLAVLRGAPC